ncbi:MAG: Lrp/AsnC family transcriptional regulator [Desulfobacterales bacterium]|nr:Lrp/AsnC family transcriptional regulator [Desulfobacterales bacterium]
MTKNTIDTIDKQLICKLSEDGRLQAGKIGEHLNITSPTVRSRLKALTDAAVLKIAGLVDAYKTRGLTTAFVGIQLETYQLDTKLEEISALDQVVWACVVTGQYDIIVEVISVDGMVGLHHFLSEKLYKVGGIKSSETFVVMKSKRKWILLPKGIRDKLESTNLTIDEP